MNDEASNEVRNATTQAINGTQRLSLSIAALDGHELHVISMTGRESISRPYAFEITFLCLDELDGERVIGKAAQATLSTPAGELRIAGVVEEFVFGGPRAADDFTYRLVIGPRLNLLGLCRQNQVYGTDKPVTVKDVIVGEIDNSISRNSTSGGHATTIDYSMRLVSDYPSREHIVQFDETDLAFLSRTCEHFGIFYFFEHGQSGETVIFGDSNLAFDKADLGSGDSLPFRPGLGFDDPGSMTAFTCAWRPVPERVLLREYNEMTPGMQLLASADTQGGGIGKVVEYGQDFATPDEGNRLAKIRAEEIACRKQRFYGQSTATQLRAGSFFTLSDHPNRSMNGRYLIVSVEHEMVNANIVAGATAKPYGNRIECIRFDVPFRPERVTPKPILAGVFTATVDGAGDGQRAEIDQHGRYKVRHFYDESNSPEGSASEFVRKAQPYAGADDTGMHFPLLKGTEVVMSYINGDPDRPIIVGAVPNPLTPSVVQSNNNTLNRIRSPSGSMFEISDGPSGSGPGGGSGGSVPAAGHASAQPGTPAYGALTASVTLPPAQHHDITNQSHFKADNAANLASPPYVRLISPDGKATTWDKASYLRLGTAPGTEEKPITLSDVKVTNTALKDPSKPTTSMKAEDDVKSTQDKIDKGDAVSTDKTFVNQSQKTQKVELADPVDRTGPSASGINVSTSGDLQLHTTGAAYMKFEDGHSTYVTKQDSNYKVQQGKLYASGHIGVKITAGDSTQPADLELVAYNYIKQTAYGPLDETTYGDSHKTTHGNSWDHFNGDKHSWFQGKTDSWSMSAEVAGKMSSSLSMFFGLASSIKLSAEFNLTVGSKMDFVVGLDFKLVLAGSIKLVPMGWDVSVISSGVKTVTGSDSKFVAGEDFKLVMGSDNKIVNGSALTIVNGAKTDWVANKNTMEELTAVLGKMNIKNSSIDAKVENVTFTTTMMSNTT